MWRSRPRERVTVAVGCLSPRRIILPGLGLSSLFLTRTHAHDRMHPNIHTTFYFILFSEPKLRDLLGLGLRLGGSREGFDYSPRFRFGPREFAISYAESALTKIVSLLRPATGHCTRGAYQRRATACRSARHHTLKKTSSPGNCGSEGGCYHGGGVDIYIYCVQRLSALVLSRALC